MSHLHDSIGLFGCLLALVALLLGLLKQLPYRHKKATLLIIAIVIIIAAASAVVPLKHGLSSLAYIRAVLGDLSISSMILLSVMIASVCTGRRYISSVTRFRLNHIVLSGAVILYPLGLGLTPYDTYAAGYGGFSMLMLMIIVVGYVLWRREYFILSLLLAAVCAYLMNVLPSNNLWDYLLDPWLVAVVLVRYIVVVSQQASRRFKELIT